MRIGPGKFSNTQSCRRNSNPGGRVIGSNTRSPLKDIDVDHAIVQTSETEKSVVDGCGSNLHIGPRELKCLTSVRTRGISRVF
jgi:hypothetical protein